MHLPISLRYARTLGLDALSMSAKFHNSWGDFHSFKNRAAMEFECFRALALGAKCSIGDQLHPVGRMCSATYDLIGSVYEHVEEKEPWCRGARPVTEIAVFSPEEFNGEMVSAPASGVARMLQEGFHQFDLVDSQSDLSPYRLVILPDVISVSPQLAGKLTRYLAQGGALIASHKSALNPEAAAFARDVLGITRQRRRAVQSGFPPPHGSSQPRIATERSGDVSEGSGSGGRAGVRGARGGGRALLQSRRQVLLAWPYALLRPGRLSGYRAQGAGHLLRAPHFRAISEERAAWCKQLFLNAVDLLLPEPLVRSNAPSTALITVNEQPAENLWVMHMLHYIPERRSEELDIIEDVIPLYDIFVQLQVPRQVREVRLVPEEQALSFTQDERGVGFHVPEVYGHQMVAIEFEEN